MNNIINNAFKHKNGATRYTHIKVGRNKSYFTSDPLNGGSKYTANDICKMIEFLVDNIYVRFGGQLFQQMVSIPMGNKPHYWLTCLNLYSYENEFLDKLIKEGKRKLARMFNLSYHYIDDLISFNNKRFKEFISDIYPKELTISETTESTLPSLIRSNATLCCFFLGDSVPWNNSSSENILGTMTLHMKTAFRGCMWHKGMVALEFSTTSI